MPAWQRKLARAKITEERLRDIIIESVREHLPSAIVRVTGPQDFEVSTESTKKVLVIHTGNAFLDLEPEWESRLELVERHVLGAVAAFEDMTTVRPPLSRNAIVPRIKDARFFETEEVDQDYLKSMKRIHLAADLYVTFAESTGEGFFFLTGNDLAPLQLTDQELLTVAVRNMGTRISPAEVCGSAPVYMVTCGGDYEACLLLDRELWVSLGFRVAGDPVAVAPAKDLLYFTGTDEPCGISRLVSLAEESTRNGLSYAITSTLITLRNGEWHPYDDCRY